MAACDRQAEARSANRAARDFLIEGQQNGLEGSVRDPDACIGDLEDVPLASDRPETQSYAPAGGELHRISGEIDEDLAKFARIADNPGTAGREALKPKLERLLRTLIFEQNA